LVGEELVVVGGEDGFHLEGLEAGFEGVGKGGLEDIWERFGIKSEGGEEVVGVVSEGLMDFRHGKRVRAWE
jgi:hypothetical protein